MPQLMLMIQQDILAGGTETIAAQWFSFEGIQAPAGFAGVQEGPVDAGKVPVVEGYTFVGAFLNGIAVKNIGQIEYDGQTYVYYTTDGSSDVAALILKEGMQIVLRYKQNAVPINYSVTVDGGEPVANHTVMGIPYGGSAPSPVKVIPDSNPAQVFPETAIPSPWSSPGDILPLFP
ncbi:MAG: hypothetical protein V8T45_01895 [Oscillospiraceae bacterium]